MEARHLYSGVFQEEVCMQLLCSCDKIIHTLFQDLFEKLSGNPEKFEQCIRQVKAWSQLILENEVTNLVQNIVDLEDLLKGSFVVFVKSFYQRPGCPKLQIRLSVPCVKKFVTNFIQEASEHKVLRTGLYFSPSSRLLAKDMNMDLIRNIFHGFLADYVIAHEIVSETKPIDDVQADDSVSNVGESTEKDSTHGEEKNTRIMKLEKADGVLKEEKQETLPKPQSVISNFRKSVAESQHSGSQKKIEDNLCISHVGSLRNNAQDGVHTQLNSYESESDTSDDTSSTLSDVQSIASRQSQTLNTTMSIQNPDEK